MSSRIEPHSHRLHHPACQCGDDIRARAKTEFDFRRCPLYRGVMARLAALYEKPFADGRNSGFGLHHESEAKDPKASANTIAWYHEISVIESTNGLPAAVVARPNECCWLASSKGSLSQQPEETGRASPPALVRPLTLGFHKPCSPKSINSPALGAIDPLTKMIRGWAELACHSLEDIILNI